MLTGELLIGRAARRGADGELRASAAATGKPLEPAFGGATAQDLEDACAPAEAAFDPYRARPLQDRARFLETIAQNILDLGDELVERCMAETGLLKGRVEGERGRTVGQLRLFAEVVRQGGFLDARIDRALPERRPAPRSDIRLRMIGVGPVAVFGPSNFPLAFSVAGGDTASALAAGCPVIVKAHSAHPGTSELVGRAIQAAATACAMPEGVFSLLFATSRKIAQGLVADRRIKAVGFTGSRHAGTGFMQIAAERAEPIPVYAEMSSINPVVVLPDALAARGGAIARSFIASLTLGAGQFCTNPGLVLVIPGPGYQEFLDAGAAALTEVEAATMLTPSILQSYNEGIGALIAHAEVTTVARGGEAGPLQGQPGLFETSAETLERSQELQGEVFGAASLVVRCADLATVRAVLGRLEGQLTVALQADAGDHAAVRELVPLLERKAGRLIVNGFGTGVEVCHAMVHGGPFPATSDSRTTSVGTLAIRRFLRPVCYQDFAADLLPPELADANPWRVPQQIDPVA